MTRNELTEEVREAIIGWMDKLDAPIVLKVEDETEDRLKYTFYIDKEKLDND